MKFLKDRSNALLVEQKALAEHFKDVESFQSRRVRTQKQTSRALIGIATIALLANIALAWTIAGMLPLSKIVPVFLWVRPDGTVDSSISMSQLPPTQSQAVIRASLWEYVRYREGYTFDTAQYGYDMVTNYSAPNVAERYQKFFNYPNKESPQVILGKKGTITVGHISTSDIAPAVLQIRFTRTVTVEGLSPVVTTMTATIGYATIRNMPAAVRLTNPGGVLVTSYQSSEDSAK